jgi:RNA polymerase sigma factor (sigma-70 family)
MDEIAAILEPHIPGLRRYAWALVRDREAADDLVQDCLEHALAAWHTRRRDGSPKAWLFTILRNLHVSELRRRSRRGTRANVEEADSVEDTFREGDPERRLIFRDCLSALEKLPEEQKSILLLVGVEDLSYADMSKVLDIPIGTVMSRLSRARERLRQAIETGSAPALRRVK